MASRKLGFERLVTLCIDSKGAGEGAKPKLHTLRLALMVGDSTPKAHNEIVAFRGLRGSSTLEFVVLYLQTCAQRR